MVRSAGAATATYTATFDHAGGLVIGIADMDVYDAATPADIAAAAVDARADDLWVVDANLPAEVIDFLVMEAATASRPVAALTVSPVKALRLKPLLDRIAILFTNRREAIYTKDELLVDDSGKPKHLPWEDWRAGEDLHTSGWMRATSPSGVAAFEGTPGWSGELGYGVRPPEPEQAVRDALHGHSGAEHGHEDH